MVPVSSANAFMCMIHVSVQGITKKIAHLPRWASNFYNLLPNHRISLLAATCIYLTLCTMSLAHTGR